MNSGKLRIEAAEGDWELPDQLTIEQLLLANGLPPSMFQAYVGSGRAVRPVSSVRTANELLTEEGDVLVRCLRNTLLSRVLPRRTVTGDVTDAVTSVTELETGVDGEIVAKQHGINAAQAQRIVVDQVAGFLQQYPPRSNLVFGLSGGGDSNAVAYGLSNALLRSGGALAVETFTLVFPPIFSQAAADRAAALCQELELAHRVLAPQELGELLGLRTSVDALWKDFQLLYGREALHFFGTFLVLRSASALAESENAHDIVFGYNREDVLAEVLFLLLNGKAPLAFPVRDLGDLRILMPVWSIPKRILDACYPRFSLENYLERDAYTTSQRSLAFYLAHLIDSSYPNLGQSLLSGVRQAFEGRFTAAVHSQQLGFVTTPFAEAEDVTRAGTMLARHFPQVG